MLELHLLCLDHGFDLLLAFLQESFAVFCEFGFEGLELWCLAELLLLDVGDDGVVVDVTVFEVKLVVHLLQPHVFISGRK